MEQTQNDTIDKVGTLYIVGTPIGNLEDITYRAVRILSEVDVVAAEDTRHTGMLLKHLQISTQLMSCHEHNEKAKVDQLAKILESGRDVALVSDAGMPVISDPGQTVVAELAKRGFVISVIPGPSAGISAFAVSGIISEGFVFQGFLPRKKRERIAELDRLQLEKRAVILYEAPHRIKQTLGEMAAKMPQRKLCIARELTKKFEEILRGTVEEIEAHFMVKEPRGEFVLVLAGTNEDIAAQSAECISLEDDGCLELLHDEIELMVEQDMQRSEAIKQVAVKYGVPRRDLYQRLLDMRADR